VHRDLVRSSLPYVSWKDPKAVARDLRKIYSAGTEEAAAAVLDFFSIVFEGRVPV